MTEITIFYICPACGRAAVDPDTTITHGYTPTADDLLRRPQLGSVGDQQLHCRCGNVYTWFRARKVTYKGRT